MINIVPYKTQDELYDAVAHLFVEIVQKNKTNIAVPTGNTPTLLYARLIKNSTINWSTINIFMLDCYYPQDPRDPESFYMYIQNNLLRHISLPEKNFHILESNTKDPAHECKQYEEAIRNAGGLDMAILGLGVNGHIAFNEPGTSSNSLTHVAKLQNQKFTYGLTVGIKTITTAKKIVVLATGKNKAEAVKNAIHGAVNESCPASFLQDHPDTTFFLDEYASSLL